MKMKTYQLTFCLVLFAIIQPWSTAFSQEVPLEDLNEKWSFYGEGQRQMNFGMFHMQEGPASKGVMIVSPEPYVADVTVSYEMMPMSAASVCVILLNASDEDEGQTLTVPADYDGSIGLWTAGTSNYFFAFHNEAHNATPFLKRFPDKGDLYRSEKNVMQPGNFYTVETGRSGNKLWMKIDGKRILKFTDPDPMAGGHVAFRIRGLNGEPASCLIRKVIIE